MHCAHARYVWNIGLEQRLMRVRGRWSPTMFDQCKQLTEARAAFDWLAAGSATVQQGALRDLDAAWQQVFKKTSRRPSWRKLGGRAGFRIVGKQAKRIEHINRRWSQALIPKVGWVKFRRTRDIPAASSYRVTHDAAGRWHIAFASIPTPIDGPRDGSTVGIDLGVTATLTLSDGAVHQIPKSSSVRSAARALSRCKRGSNRRKRAKLNLARAHARNADQRKDFLEKATTTVAQNYDLIRIEDLTVGNLTKSARGTKTSPGRNVRQKSALNRAILDSGWGTFSTRLSQKALGRVEKVNPRFTSQRCSVCQHVARESRKSQALFQCVACGHTSNADLNAAKNIAAGLAVRGAENVSVLKREPQHLC